MDRLDYFYTRYIQTLKLSVMPLLDLYAGVNFLTLDECNFLSVTALMGELCEVFIAKSYGRVENKLVQIRSNHQGGFVCSQTLLNEKCLFVEKPYSVLRFIIIHKLLNFG